MANYIFKGSRFKEWGKLAKNNDHVIDWEYVPPESHLLGMISGMVLGSESEQDVETYQHYQITDLWLPVFDADSQISVWETTAATRNANIKTALETLVDRRFPKMENVSTRTAVSADYTQDLLGTADPTVMWDPSRISKGALSDLRVNSVINVIRGKLGYAYGSAFRNGPNDKVKFLHNYSDILPLNVKMPADMAGYYIRMLTIPQEVNDANSEISHHFPVDGDPRNIDFLKSPDQMDSIFNKGIESDEDDYRRWAVTYLIEQGTGGSKRQVADDLYAHVSRECEFLRSDTRGDVVVDPQPGAGS